MPGEGLVTVKVFLRGGSVPIAIFRNVADNQTSIVDLIASVMSGKMDAAYRARVEGSSAGDYWMEISAPGEPNAG